MKDSKKENSGKALVGVVVEIPFTSEHDLDSADVVREIASSKIAQDCIAALLGGIMSHKEYSSDEIKVWFSNAISEVSGQWVEYNG